MHAVTARTRRSRRVAPVARRGRYMRPPASTNAGRRLRAARAAWARLDFAPGRPTDACARCIRPPTAEYAASAGRAARSGLRRGGPMSRWQTIAPGEAAV